ncbi:AsmA family protein [Marinobacterium rhizophilum]|uniref:AsmA family protein n=1 Tax=Marinobacterium rhizophilum TaxID=420402 RepID=A0ABY5HE89_9GAMM|nr:AsmA family protein [Marinobacterium rhizophilum]UTW10666.1 AsmA family protein [Marinobacterium rhizophilum]
MKGLTKLLLGLVALVVILIASAGILLGVFFEPNDYKSDIEALALEKAGLELSIDGDIGWSVFPWLGLQIGQVKLQYPQQPALASLEQAQVSVKLLPLLSSKVEMSSITVDGLDLNLVQAADGSNNWSLPGAEPETAGADTADTADTADSATDAGAAVALDIESIAVTNGRIGYADLKADSRVQLQDLALTSGRIRQGEYFPLDLSFRLDQSAGEAAALSAATTLKAEVQLDPKTQQYRLRGLDSSVQLQLAALGEKPLELKLSGDVAADLVAQLARIDNLNLSLAGLSASGSLSVQDFAEPALGGELKLAAFNPRSLLEQLGQPLPAMADETALTQLSLSAVLGGSASQLSLKPLTLTLDDTHFNGALAYGLSDGAISLDLAGDALNADRYLPPQSDASQTGGQAESQAGGAERYSKEEVIPLEPLRSLLLDGQFKLQQLQVSGVTLSDLDLAVNARNGLVNASRINANLFGGTVRNSAVLDVSRTPVTLKSSKTVSGLQIGDLLQALDGAEKPAMTGTLSSQADISAQGRSVHAIVNSLNGTARFNVADGTISGIDMAQTVCQGFNNLASLGINAEQVDGSTPFANLGGNFNIRNGVISNDDLQATLDAIGLKGKGSVDLPRALIDYRLGLTIQEDLFKQSCSVNNKIQGVEWPVNCKGSFDTPPAQLCRPDLSVFEDLLKARLKQDVQQKVEEKVKEGIQEKLGDDAKQLLKGLFGN